MNYEYYYNNVPGVGQTRNNLIYTSLISTDKKTFVQWYHNDTGYHKGKNQVVDPSKMEEKWLREVNYLTQMRNSYPELVPIIKNIDLAAKKLYLEIDGPDFWELAGCNSANFDNVLPDWQDQMLNIIQTHKNLGWHKYSMHPSSYFIVDGRLKSINYFFAYNASEPAITVNQVISHISDERVESAKLIADKHGITFDTPIDLKSFQLMIFESFGTNYPKDFVEELKKVYL